MTQIASKVSLLFYLSITIAANFQYVLRTQMSVNDEIKLYIHT